MADETMCRHCGGTGVLIEGDPCFACGAGRALMEQQPAQANEPRAIIQAFAAAMERKLAANDDRKGAWRQSGTFHLLGAMHQEVNEFVDALNMLVNLEDDGAPDDILAKSRQALCDEAADVANYLAMVLDVCGALPPTDERGR